VAFEEVFTIASDDEIELQKEGLSIKKKNYLDQVSQNMASKLGKVPQKELIYPLNDEVVWDDENYLKIFDKKQQGAMYILFQLLEVRPGFPKGTPVGFVVHSLCDPVDAKVRHGYFEAALTKQPLSF